MKSNKRLLILLFAILIFGLGFWNLNLQDKKAIQNESLPKKYKASLLIKDGDYSKPFDISPYIGKSALEATSKVLDGNIKTTGTGTNTFVVGLSGRLADNKKHEFWEFGVNGNQAQVGAGSYIIQNNDEIVWKISTY